MSLVLLVLVLTLLVLLPFLYQLCMQTVQRCHTLSHSNLQRGGNTQHVLRQVLHARGARTSLEPRCNPMKQSIPIVWADVTRSGNFDAFITYGSVRLWVGLWVGLWVRLGRVAALRCGAQHVVRFKHSQH